VNFNPQELMIHQPIRHFDYLNLGHRQAKPEPKPSCEKFADESAGAERVVLELDCIEGTIGRLHQVGLGSAFKRTNVPDCGKGDVQAQGLRREDRPGKVNVSHIVPARQADVVRARSVLVALGVARWFIVWKFLLAFSVFASDIAFSCHWRSLAGAFERSQFPLASKDGRPYCL
jgi:hypothetical protein